MKSWPGVLILAAHAVGALATWWLLPHGFPVKHPRFWAHQVLPLVAVAVACLGIAARSRGWNAPWYAALVAFPAAWFAGAIAFRVVFPISARLLWLFPLACGAWLAWSAYRLGALRGRWRESLIATVGGTAVAMAITLALRGPESSTRPVAERPPGDGPAGIRLDRWPVEVGAAQVVPGDGAVLFQLGMQRLRVEPLLTFFSRSPDRFMTVVARTEDRVGPQRRLLGASAEETVALFRYESDFEQLLTVERSGDDAAVAVEAWARLAEPIYSHLNSFCELHLQSVSQPAIAFSPCGDERIEITVSDYPFGRPRRLAYFEQTDSGGQLRVVEARSGEKGPFRHLASGPLGRDAPLTMTLCEGPTPLCRVTLTDWARQASTDLSPTAGWGLPMNAIEFSLDEDSGTASLWITLAGTSVGRGFDSVGHAAGVYRNRMLIEPLVEAPPVVPAPDATGSARE